MTDLSSIILKSGISSLIYENEESFKKSLINSLSFKLNEALKEVQHSFASKILVSEETTVVNKDIKTLLEFIDSYESNSNNSLNFKNGSTINIKENEIEKIKFLFNSLNPKNRELMAKELLEDYAGFKRSMEFYDKAQRIIK